MKKVINELNELIGYREGIKLFSFTFNSKSFYLSWKAAQTHLIGCVRYTILEFV